MGGTAQIIPRPTLALFAHIGHGASGRRLCLLARGAHLVRQLSLFSRGSFVTRNRRAVGAIRRAVCDGGELRGRKRVRDEGGARPPRLMLSDYVVPQISGLLS